MANPHRTQLWAAWTAPLISNGANVRLRSTNKRPAFASVDEPIGDLQDEMNRDFVEPINRFYANCVL
jgi:hypothetical protein